MTQTEDLTVLLARVPTGWTSVRFGGRPWSLRRTEHAGGRSLSVFAEQLGDTAIISANVYRTADGDVLKPCEMPAQDVLAFLRGWELAEPEGLTERPAG